MSGIFKVEMSCSQFPRRCLVIEHIFQVPAKRHVSFKKTILVNVYLRPWLMPRERAQTGSEKLGLLPPTNRRVGAIFLK